MDTMKSDFYKQLTWRDIQDWAGETIAARGRTYQRSNSVQNLAIAPDGKLIAWVQGSQQYITTVDVENSELGSTCTCPYGGTCKHAVAVVLEYLDHLKRNVRVPLAAEDDPRFTSLEEEAEEDEDENEEDSDFSGEELEEIDERQIIKPGRKKTTLKTLQAFLEKQNREQLLSLLKSIAERYPEAREFLTDHFQVSSGQAAKLIAATRKEINRVSSEMAYSGRWGNAGYTPDYSGVKNRLEMLLTQGYADEVLELGRDLFEASAQQVEESDDEGELENEIQSCLKIVFQALPRSSLSKAEQILWLIDMELEDDYDLTSGAEGFWERTQKASDWSIVADKLLQRLKDLEAGSFHREHLTNWTIRALEESNRQDEILPLCRDEAIKSDSYARLVHCLLDVNRTDEAQEWIHKGIAATQKSKPGIASRLREMLREIKEKEGDWLSAAGFLADDFLIHPNLHNFEELRQASEKAGVWPAVRQAIMEYLETGQRPSGPAWPLPEPEVRETDITPPGEFPVIETLIQIAMAEKQPAEIVRWYDYYLNHRKKTGYFETWSYIPEDQIAAAIAESYPEKAISIWKKLAEGLIAQTQVGAYQHAGMYLADIKRVFIKSGREEEWKNYLDGLRLANIRKRRFLEVLDSLNEKPIVEKE